MQVVNVNQVRTTDGASPLYIASQHGNVDTVKVLIKAGANVNQADFLPIIPTYTIYRHKC